MSSSSSIWLPFHWLLIDTAYDVDLVESKAPPRPPIQLSLVAEPQLTTLLMRVLLSVVDGRKAKIWCGVPIPSSIPRATPRPSCVTLRLAQVSVRGGMSHCAPTREGCTLKRAARLNVKLLSMRHDGAMALMWAKTCACPIDSSYRSIKVSSLGREGEVSRQRD